MTPRATALAVLAAMAAAPAAAERAVSPEEFDALTAGTTWHFERRGVPFGAERYFEDRRVVWAFEGGACQRGIWFANTAGEICFVYDSDPAPQCWSFLEMPSGAFHARLPGAPPADDLVAVDVDDAALDCPLEGPGV
jgi:hypothetical protein